MGTLIRNNQKPEKVVLNNYKLTITNIFKTIQGEGPFSGHRALFIRLAGCNLQCPLCDTDYTSNIRNYSINELSERINSLWPKDRLIVITGGEPFRQIAITEFIKILSRDYVVQIETNGTLPFYDLPNDDRIIVICSPKTPKLNNKSLWRIDHYKYVIDHNSINLDGLPKNVLGFDRKQAVARPPKNFRGNIYVQPMDAGNIEENKKNLATTVHVAQKFGYILQLQIHKLIGVP